MGTAELSASYRGVGVLTNTELGLDNLLKKWIRPTERYRAGKSGQSAMDVGYFAQVIDLGKGLGLALTTDGVGTKILIAEMLGRYDTIGIDCVAMNVNDLICVGAEPVSMLDYIAVEKGDPDVLEALGQGLQEGARQSGISIVGGEISQMGEMIRGVQRGGGLDLVGMCVGVVAIDDINVGQSVTPGDLIVGIGSSGVHCNGLSLARRALFDMGKLKPDAYREDLGRTVGEELLEPTQIYVSLVMELVREQSSIKAMINITSDGFLNLTRIKPPVSFRITSLPEPQPIFPLIQHLGNISDAEMYHVFNMGIGFCLICPNDSGVLDSVQQTVREHGLRSQVIGEVSPGADRTVEIVEKRLLGRGDRFAPIA